MNGDKKSTYELYQLGINLLETGNPAQAAAVLERARAGEPDKGSICEALGRAYFSYGRFWEAAINFRCSIGIDPTNHYAHYGLALCLERLGQFVKSYGHIKLALVMRPGLEEYEKVSNRLEHLLSGKND